MSYDNTGSTFSSYGSDPSEFDPEDEALASTKRLDNSPGGLPKMKERVVRNVEEPDYDINTSTIERALPDFSQMHTSEEEEHGQSNDEDVSIEMGRGAHKQRDDSRSSVMSFYNSIRSSSPAIKVDYPSPRPAMRGGSAKRSVSENLRRDAQVRQASRAKRDVPESQPQAQPQLRSNRRERRTLSDMHARVRDNYEGSLIEDERPSPAPISTRTTRFGSNISKRVADAVDKARDEAFAREMRLAIEKQNTRKSRNASGNAAGDTGTYQSIVLPDFLSMSELVSGLYDDATPRQNRVRATRFVSPPNDGTDMSFSREHAPLDFVPIPEDERALFVSLKLLQDKAADLELAKTDAEKKMDELRRENASLKAGRSRRKDKHEQEPEPHRRAPAEQPRKSTAAKEDDTLLSLIDENEIAKLRRQLEAERLALKQRESTTKVDLGDETMEFTQNSLPSTANLRKSTMKENKEPTVRSAVADETGPSTQRSLSKSAQRAQPVNEQKEPTVRPASAGNDMGTTSKASADATPSAPRERRRRNSDRSEAPASHRRQRQSTDEVTSAFILPDITLDQPDAHLDNVAQHKGKNCTVCKRTVPDDYTCNHMLNIPRPVPVSDRFADGRAYEEDFTMRPAQQPGLALATVLKALEDELSHMRMQLATYQGSYYKLDASMNKRKRKSLRQKIEHLLQHADMKADQIYALYDVLEGQKKARHQMTEQEMDETLHSIGIDVEAPAEKPAKASNISQKQPESDFDEDDDDDDLPWEGLESTGEITGRVDY